MKPKTTPGRTKKEPSANDKVKRIEVSGSSRKRAPNIPVVVKKKVPALLAPTAKRRISKIADLDLSSILGDSSEEIQQLLEMNNSDSATMLMQKRLLQSLVDLIPLAENAIRASNGSKGVYQFNSLVTSLREILIDVQSTKDRGALGDALVEKIIRPAFLDLGMTLIQEDALVGSAVQDALKPADWKVVKEAREKSLQRLAVYLQKQYGQVKESSIQFLQR